MPTKIIELSDAQKNLSLLIEQTEAGTEILIMEGDFIRARLIPMAAPTAQRRIVGLHQGCITTEDDFDQPLSDGFWSGANTNRNLRFSF